MPRILLIIILFFSLDTALTQNISNKNLQLIHKECYNLLEEYEIYFNFIGDKEEPFNDRKNAYTNTFLKLFTASNAWVVNDLDPEGNTSEGFSVEQYAGNIITWYTSAGIRCNLNLNNITFGKINKLPTGDYYINVYVKKQITGIFMNKKTNSKPYKLEFRIAFKKSGLGYSNFHIVGITKPNQDELTKEIILEEIKNVPPKKVIVNKGTFADPRDGQIYKTVTIGEQTWFAENLNYKTQKSFCPQNIFCALYGRLYTWKDAQKACPSGWHLSSDSEWKTMEIYLGMSQSQADATGARGIDVGGQLKETGIKNWRSPNNGATNSSGFTALPGGGSFQDGSGEFGYSTKEGFWWSDIRRLKKYAWSRSLRYDRNTVYREERVKTTRVKLSVRCIKD